MSNRPIDAAKYLEPGVNPRTMQERFTLLKQVIKSSGVRFDAIAFRGFSGCIYGPALAMHYGKHAVYVRKDIELRRNDDTADSGRSHSWRELEGCPADGGSVDYIIVDELCSSGRTIRAIRDALDKIRGTCVGIFLWNQNPMLIFSAPKFPRGIPCHVYNGRTWECLFEPLGCNTELEMLELSVRIDSMLAQKKLPKLKLLPEYCDGGLQEPHSMVDGMVDEAAGVDETVYKETLWSGDTMEWKFPRAAFISTPVGLSPLGFVNGNDSPDAPQKTATQVMRGQE